VAQCPLTSFFWLLSHVIYLKLTRVLQECLLSQSWVMSSKTVNYTKNLFGTWQFGKIDVLVNVIILKVARLKSKHFSQFFWWEVNLRILRAFILQKVQALVVERQKNKFCWSMDFIRSHLFWMQLWSVAHFHPYFWVGLLLHPPKIEDGNGQLHRCILPVSFPVDLLLP
jgi:hypothetical protein